MTYRVPTLPEQALIARAGLPSDANIRYYIEPNPTSKHWTGVDYELEWVRCEQNLVPGSHWSDSGPEYDEHRVNEFEEGTLDGLTGRVDALLAPDSERFEDTLIEITVLATALDGYAAERPIYQEAIAA